MDDQWQDADEQFRVLDLFSGIGGFSKGLEDSGGFKTVAFCEIEKFPRAVLKKHWPKVWCHDDVRTLTAELVQQRCGTVDLVCGGVPCQPASVAGKRQGAKDERWLWGEFMRLVRGIRPRWVIAENVPGFLSLGDESEAVFRELEQEGYEVWPLIVGADDVGAPHRRKRLWIVANSNGDGRKQSHRRIEKIGQWFGNCGETMANSTSGILRIDGSAPRSAGYADERGEMLANGNVSRLEINEGERSDNDTQRTATIGSRWPARPGERQHEWEQPRLADAEMWAARWREQHAQDGGEERHPQGSDDAKPQQPVGRAANGISTRLVRANNRHALRALGNAVVPQIPELIGRAIMEVEH